MRYNIGKLGTRSGELIMEINEQLKKHRIFNNFTQKEMALQLGIDSTTYAHYESGRRTPNVKMWMKIAKILKIPEIPAQTVVTYPKGMLDLFEKIINDNRRPSQTGKISIDYHNNNSKIETIQNFIFKILDERAKSMDYEHLQIDKLIQSGFTGTLINCQLDVRGEYLINEAMQSVSELMRANGQ